MTDHRDSDQYQKPMTGQEIKTKKLQANLKDQVLILSSPVGIFRLNKTRIVIGSVVSADVRLDGEAVAPIHAVIEMPESLNSSDDEGLPGVMIYDLASESGVFVNGRKVITQVIKSGDQIAIGSYLLTVSLNDFDDLQKSIPKQEMLYTSGSRNDGGGKPLLLSPHEDVNSLLLEDEREVESIFDYRPAQKRALEVVMSWRGTILDVQHFVNKGVVTIGASRKNNFGIPAVIPLSRGIFTFVRYRGEDGSIYLDPKMKGVIQRRGKLESLEQFRNEVPISQDDFAKVSIGEVDFYLSYTAAPPRLKAPRLLERDPFFLKVFWISMGLSLLVIQLLWNARVSTTVEAEQIPERIATILYNPEKYIPKSEIAKAVSMAQLQVRPTPASTPTPTKTPEPEKTVKVEITPVPQATPKPVPREMNMTKPVAEVEKSRAKAAPSKPAQKTATGSQNEAREGAGARAKGIEGTRGQPNAPADSMHQDKAVRTGPGGGVGSGGGNSQVPGIGNVDLLNTATAKITDILGNGADRLGKGGEKLRGFGAFTTQGSGGLALSGSGQGGGGTADTTLGGLSDHGTGGGKVGTGKGAAGNGNGIVGGQVRVAIRTGGEEEAFVMGSIDKDAIAAAMQAHYDEFRVCYEREVNAENPNLAGRVGTTFVIGSTGRVTQAGIQSTTLNNANTERCILDVIRRINFPIPRGAGIVQVSYPFKFNRSNGR